MSKSLQMKKELDIAMESAKRIAISQICLRHPSATIDDLIELSKGLNIGDMTIGEIRGGTGGVGVRKSRTRSIASKSSIPLRTIEEREDWLNKVEKFLKSKGDFVSALGVRSELGGTPQQVRSAMRSLHKRGSIEVRGKTAGTVYRIRRNVRKRKRAN